MADTEANAGVSHNNGTPAGGNGPVAEPTIEVVAATGLPPEPRREEPASPAAEPSSDGRVLAPLVSEATGAREEAAAAPLPTAASAADPSVEIDLEAPGEPADAQPEAAAPSSDPASPLAAAPLADPATTVVPEAEPVAADAPSAHAIAEASQAESDSGRVAAPVFDDESSLDSGPAVIGAHAEAALAALDSSPTMPPPAIENDDRTVITTAPPLHETVPVRAAVEVPLAPEGTQPGADLEVLGVTEMVTTRESAPTVTVPAATASPLARWAEQARPRRRSTIEIVRKLAARRVDVSSLQLGIIVVGAALAGGLVSRAVASGAAPRPTITAVQVAPIPAAPVVAARPASQPIVTPLPAEPAAPAAAPAKPAKPAKGLRKRTLASAAHDAKPAAAKR